MKDQALSYITRMESDLNFKATQDVFAGLDMRLKRLEERAANMDGRIWGFGGCGFTVLNVFLSWWLANVHAIN
jgi:hypothetical protein